MDDRVLNTKEIAAALGCSHRTVLRLHKDNKLPGSFKLSGRGSPVKIGESALRKFIMSIANTGER